MDKSLLRCAIKTWPILRNYTSLTSRASCRRIIPQEHSSITENTNTNKEDYDDAYDKKKLYDSKEFYLQSEFRSANSLEKVFGLLQDKKYELDSAEAIAATRQIYKLAKKKSSRPEPPIGSRKEFMKLCEVMQKNISLLHANSAVHLLRSLSLPNMGVPITSSICQSVLKNLSCNIYDLSLKNISFLQHILKNQEESVLSRALEISLPAVFEANLRQQLSELSFPELLTAFLYAVNHKRSDSSINYIIEMIHTRMGEFNVSDTKLLSMGLHYTNVRSMAFENTLKQFLELVVNGVHEIPFEDLRTVFENICWNTETKDKCFYNTKVIEAFVMRVVDEDRGFMVAIQSLGNLNRIRYSQIQILDYLAAKCFEDSSIIPSCQYQEINTLLEGCFISDYKPIFWKTMQDMILKHSFWETLKYHKIVDAAFRLEALGCQHHMPLHKVFKEIKSNKKHVLLQILTLHINTKILNPSYTGPLLDDDTFHSIFIQSDDWRQTFPLRRALETALGGPEYVLTNLSSRYKRVIDHVIVMRQGGYPVAINLPKDKNAAAHKKYLEDMTFPSGSQVIIIHDFPTFAHILPKHRMKAEYSRMIRALESSLYPIVPICSRLNMQNMSEQEKIPYLMQAIKSKYEEIVTDCNS